ncbi:MAG TPA: PQQ-binding-like beta-propeller repeat protein [Bryobacteraceae bacterium]|nr:PQQ-binding-like beta-propeller repeat protein [Bryobacteraceae bacterium]
MRRTCIAIAVSLAVSWAAFTLSAQTAHRRAAARKSTPTAKPAGIVEDWPVWGGKNRDFIVNTSGLADSWPAAGPRKIWSRPLGDGYSAIAEEHGVLYTAFRRDSRDVITALDAATGRTIWEFNYENPFTNSYSEAVGPGPYAMPEVIGDRVVTASGTGRIHSLDKKTGKQVWSHDLYNEFHATHLQYGFSCHALPYKDMLIYQAGGAGDGVIAFRQSDGALIWKALQFTNSHASPLLINVDGQPQVVVLASKTVFGFNPDNGALLWTHEHVTPYGLAVSTPVWAPGNILFVASAYGTGARALHLSQSGGKTTVDQLWYDPHLELHIGTAIQRDGYVYISRGYSGPVLMTAVELKTGKIMWQERGFAKAQLLYADGKLILADQDGTLALCRATPQKFEVLSKASVLQSIAWTPPTLVGTRLYLRDRKTIAAYELGK